MTDELFWNKVASGILISLIVLKLGQLISDYLFEPEKLEKNSYVIDVSSLETLEKNDNKEHVLVDIRPLLLKANLDNGEKIFKKCVQCHTHYKDGAHKTGPNLWNIVNQKYAHHENYAYSKALKEMKSTHTWTFENLNAFLYKPKVHVPGTKMSFVGIKDDQERADLILFLRSLSDAPSALQ